MKNKCYTENRYTNIQPKNNLKRKELFMSNMKSLMRFIAPIIIGVIAGSVVVLFAGCAGTKPGTGYVTDTPDEIQRLINKEYSEAIHAVGTATASDEGTATRKATVQARAEIARQFKAQIDVLQKSYEESVNDNAVQEYQQAAEVFATLDISGSKIAKSLVRKEKNNAYSAKVLVVVTAEQLKALVDEKMQAYTSFKASKAYKELEERVTRERQKGTFVEEE